MTQIVQQPAAKIIRPLRMGILGIGQGGGQILPAMAALPEIELVAGADLNPLTRQHFVERYPGARAFESVAALCAEPDIDAVWVSTPNGFHCEHAVEAMRNGKHVAVTKPMAVSMEEASRMVAASEKYGVKLLVGHTNSFEVPLRVMRKLVMSGKFGRVRAIHIWSYTDWMLRPRTPDELDPARGGGVPYRQGSHQIDVVRLLGGGLLRSVRGTTGEWMPERPIPGYHCAYLEFEDGTPATILHNGYGYSLTAEYYPWARERLRYSEEDRLRIRKGLKSGLRDDAADKQEFQIGRSGDREAARASKPAGPEPWTPADLGMVVVSCERGDLRNVQYGIAIDGDEGRREIDLTSLWAPGPWRPGWELKELYEAVALGRPVYHSGAWGLATVEATLALIQSGRERREIMLRHQVPMPVDYDADLVF